jgi:cytochrome c oxidase cbb3-type subunit IV
MNIDLNTLRSMATVISFLAFLGIVGWAYSKRNRAAFDEAAQIPFESE